MTAVLPKLPARMPVERPRARRERPGVAARRPVLHLVAPGLEIAHAIPRKGETVTAFLRRTGWATRDPKYGWQFRKRLPTILEVNGEAVLRKDWRRTKIAANDNVRFISFPRGGRGSSGKQVLGLVALIAVAAFAAAVTGGAAAGLLGAAFAKGAIGAYALGAAIGIGGSLLVNALVAPSQGATSETKADQIYTASASGNIARLGQPLPAWYGRNKDYPDFAATPWGEFVGNDQYLNVLLSVTMGSMDYEAIYNSDTLFWDRTTGIQEAFSSAQIAFYEPNETVTLFPVNVAQSDEVGGIQVPNGTGLHVPSPGGDVGNDYGDGKTPSPGAWLGPFAANPPGTKAYQIAVDYVFPGGCYIVWGKNGEIGPIDVGVTAEARLINDAGAPIGSFFTLQTSVLTVGSKSPQRGTLLAALPGDGRYEVRFRRNEGVPADNKGGAELVWAGLRAFLRGDSQFPVSTIAIRVKASETTQGSFKFGVLGSRKLPVWNGSTFVLQATRNPAWALYDMATNAQYGAEVKSAKVDFNALVNHAAGCASRGDSFDYVFKSAVVVPEAFDTALTVSRARHMWLGDTLSLVRDQWEGVPAMMLTDREIVRDGTSFEYTMLGEEDPDAVVIEYIDEDTWLPATVQYPPNSESFTSIRSETKRLNGIVNRNHAYRECAFYYLCSIYRRETGSIGCEYEGRAITMGQTLRLQSELPQDYGYAGAVTNRTSNTLTLDPAPLWTTGKQHYIRLRRPNGREFGPIRVAKGANDNLAMLNSGDLATAESQQGITLVNVLKRADGGEYPTYALGTADNQSKLAKVLTGQPNGETFTLSLVVDDERVHTTDIGNPPALPIGQFPKNDSAPLIAGLNARFGQGVAEPQLGASWFPAAGAFYYRAAVSYDGGNSWVEVYQGSDVKFEKFVTLGALTLRVQGVGQFPGPWTQVAVDAPTIEIASNTVAATSLQDGINYAITELQNKSTSELLAITDAISERLAYVAARLEKDRRVQNQQSADHRIELIDRIELVQEDAEAAIEDVRTLATGTQYSFGQYQLTVETRFQGIESNVSANATSLSNLSQSFGSYQTTVNARFVAAEGRLTTTEANAASNATAISTLNESFGNYQGTVTARFLAAEGRLTSAENRLTANEASVTSNATAIANAEESIGDLETAVFSSFGGTGIVAKVTSDSSTLATLNSSFSSFQGSATATMNGLSSSVTAQGTAISNLNGWANAQWSVKTDVNGNVMGLITLNSSNTKSTFNVVASSLYVCQPGVSGGTAVPIFAIDAVNGTNRLVFDGNMYADGGIFARSIAAAQITATHMTANSVTAANGAIANFAVQSLQIADQAVIVPVGASGSVTLNSNSSGTIVSSSASINTTGLSGKTVTVAIMTSGTTATLRYWSVDVWANGSKVGTYGVDNTLLNSFCVTSFYTFTASGGTDNVTVTVIANSSTVTQTFSAGLLILGCKR